MSEIKSFSDYTSKYNSIDKLGEAFFFGKELGLQPRDLVYLLDEVSNQYHKEISSDVINKYQFKKVDDIVNFILEG